MDVAQSSEGGLFAKFDNGTLLGVFRGDPVVFKQHGFGKTMKLCAGPSCDVCEAGERPKQRFRMNIIVQEGASWTAKIFEGGSSIYQPLKELHAEGYDLDSTLIKLTKKGSGMETEYSLMPAAKQLTPEQIKAVSEVPLRDIRPRERAVNLSDVATGAEQAPF